MSNRFEKICLMMTTIGATICITPLFVLNMQQYGDNVVSYRKPAPNLFFVIIIPAVDLLLDYLARCISYLYSDSKEKSKPVKSTVVSRLTDSERALFILGIAVQTIVLSHPSKEVLSNASIVGSSVNNCSIILTLGPIIIYLHRCTKTFTWLRTFTILSAGFIGLILFTTSYYCRSEPEKFRFEKIKLTGIVFVSLAAIILMFTILLCFGSFTIEKLKRSVAKQWFQRIFKSKKICVDEVLEDDSLKIDADTELYNNYVPALHMLSLIVIGIANTYYKTTQRNDEAKALEIRNYTSLAAEILVLVIELRIRKNEIARGLVSHRLLLDCLDDRSSRCCRAMI